MDLADDIAYSTYDLEDAFKAGFLSPLELLALDEKTLESIAKEVLENKNIPRNFNAADVLSVLMECFGGILNPTMDGGTVSPDDEPDEYRRRLKVAIVAARQSVDISTNGYVRNRTTSKLVSSAVEEIEVEYDFKCPLLSKVRLKQKMLQRVETLKRVAYLAIVQSPRLQVAEYRGSEIIQDLFAALSTGSGHKLLPLDYKELFRRFEGNSGAKHRLICDFIAGMTDAYAIEFYTRLKSENARMLFKPF